MARASDPIIAREVAVSIVRTLRAAGHVAYFAGGCVRDALLGLSPTDFDVATDATPPKVRSLFRSTDEVGASFGVVLVHERVGGAGGAGGVGGSRVTVEVATFRSDGPYTDSRRPDSVHFSDPPTDAARRDFTVNALFLDPLVPGDAGEPGRVIDFVSGLADLRAKVIRAVGVPDQRLAEDHLRALRAVRFAARFGFTIEPGTSSAIQRHAAELRGVSRERIGEELRRMLEHPSRATALELLQELGLDEPVLNEPTRKAALATVAGVAPGRAASPMLALAAWMLDRNAAVQGGLGAEAVADVKRRARAALCLSNEESDELGGLLLNHQQLIRAWTAAAIALRKRWACGAWFESACRLAAVAHPDLVSQVRADVATLAADGIGLAPRPLVTGDDLNAAGFRAGPVFGRVLAGVYDAQLEGRVRTFDAAMELAAKLYV